MQNALELLLNKYSVDVSASIIDSDNAIIGGKSVKLLPHRAERRFIEMRNLVVGGTVSGISTLRILHLAPKGTDLTAVLYREADIAEFLLNDTLCEVFAIGNQSALNLVCQTVKGYVVSFELAASLPAGKEDIDKHEIIAVSGVVCDRAADTQVPQSSIYLFGENETAFTDVDAELYGLFVDEIAAVRHTFALCKSGEDNAAQTAHIQAVCAAAKQSLATLENVVLEGK